MASANEELRGLRERVDAHESRLKIIQREVELQTMLTVIVGTVVASLVALLLSSLVAS